MRDKLLQIINRYGIEHQQRKLEEEVFELQQAITRLEYYPDEEIPENMVEYEFNKTFKLYDNLEEEIADVQVLLEQIKLYYDLIDKKIELYMQQKVDRQLERMKNE